jgi:hypothetical protein
MASVPKVPPGVRAVRDRFEAWRRAKSGREKIPDRLWSQAAALAARHGVNLVSHWLRLNHSDLRDRIGACKRPKRRKAGPAFVQWRPAAPGSFPPAAAAEYVIELDVQPGRVLRVRSRGALVADVAELARRLAEAAP